MPIQRRATPELSAAAFDLYQKDTPILKIARILLVAEPTVRKIKKRDRWDERIAEIRRQAQEKADKKRANSLASELDQINVLIPLSVRGIVAQAKTPRQCPDCKGSRSFKGQECAFCDGKGVVRYLDASIADYDKLVRLKVDVLEHVEPELPTEAPKAEAVTDKNAELLDKIDKANSTNIEALGDLIAAEVIKRRQQ